MIYEISTKNSRYAFDLDADCLTDDSGIELRISGYPLLIFRYLVAQNNKWISQEVLMQAVWKKPPATTNALDQHLNKIRKLLGDQEPYCAIEKDNGQVRLSAKVIRKSRNGDILEDLAESAEYANKTVGRSNLEARRIVLDDSLLARLGQQDIFLPSPTEPKTIQYRVSRGRANRCIICLNGLGLSELDFHAHADYFSSFDFVMLNVLGFQDQSFDFMFLTIDQHAKLLTWVINQSAEWAQYQEIYLVGFSIGADLMLEIAASGRLEFRPTKLIALDPNLNSDTLFISRHIAKIGENVSDDNLLDVVCAVSQKRPKSLVSWKSTHSYLLRILERFSGVRLYFLSDFARQVMKRYDRPGFGFVKDLILKLAHDRVEKVQIVLSDDRDKEAPEKKSNNQLFKENLRGWNAKHCECEIVHGVDHFYLLSKPDVLSPYISASS